MEPSLTKLRPGLEVQCLQPGIYLDVPFEAYLALPALSNSYLSAFARSPGQVVWQKDAPEDADAETSADLGTLVHTLALEPEALADRYLVLPELKLTTKDGREQAAEYERRAEEAGLIPVDAKTYKQARLMAESLKAYPDVRVWLEHATGHREVTILWHDEPTGQLCKARADRLVMLDTGAVVVDVKTTSDIEKIQWSIRDYGYATQQVHYTEGLKAAGVPNVWFYFAFVSSKRSLKRYPVRFVELSAERIELAEQEQRKRLADHSEAKRLDSFYGAETI